MALNVKGSDSLYWKTGLDNTGLHKDSMRTKGIIAGLVKSVSKMDLFAVFGYVATKRLQRLTSDVYKFSKDFEHAMKEVETISKGVQNNFAGISEQIMKMSKETPESALILVRALYQIESAGHHGAKAMDILRESTELAVAAVTDTFVAADALTSVMNAYRDSAISAAKASDILFTIVRLGKITMAELGPDITTITGLASALGLEFDELAAIIAESVKTLKSPIAMTGIRGLLRALVTPQKEAKKMAMELFNIELSMRRVREVGFQEFLLELLEATKDNRDALAEMFPNIRGLTSILSIASGQGMEYVKTLKEIRESTGATNDAFKIMVADTTNQMIILKNILIANTKDLGDSILAYLGFWTRAAIKMFKLVDEQTAKARQQRMRKLITPPEPVSLAQIGMFGGPRGGILGTKPEFDVTKRITELNKLGYDTIGLYDRLNAILLTTGDIREDLIKRLETELLLNKENAEAAKREAAIKKPPKKEVSPFWDLMTPEEMEAFILKMTLLHEKAVEEGKELERKYRDWKISNSKELLVAEIKVLKEYMSRYGEAENYKTGRIDEYERRLEQLHQFELDAQKEISDAQKEISEKHKASLDRMLKDTRGWSKAELQIYAKFLLEQAELWKDNEAMHKQILEEYSKTSKKIYGVEIKTIREIGKAFDALGDLVSEFDKGLGELVKSISDITSSMIELSDATTDWGKFAGYLEIFTSVYQTIKSIMDSIYDVPLYSEMVNKLKAVTDELEKQRDLLNISYGDDRIAKQKKIIELLKEQAKIEARINSHIIARDMIRRRRDRDEVDVEVEYAERQLREMLTLTTGPAIADSIADGFMKGLDSAEVFAKTFEELMRDAIMGAFKRKIIDDYLSDWYGFFADEMEMWTEYDLKTKAEAMADLSTNLKNRIKEIGTIFEGLEEVLEEVGIGPVTPGEAPTKGLAGAFKGVSEKTAGLLAGQFNAMRLDIKEGIESLNKLVDSMKGVSDDTNIVAELRAIRDDLLKLNSLKYWAEETTKSVRILGTEGSVIAELRAIRDDLSDMHGTGKWILDKIRDMRTKDFVDLRALKLSSILNVLNDIYSTNIDISNNTYLLHSIDDKLDRLPEGNNWVRAIGG